MRTYLLNSLNYSAKMVILSPTGPNHWTWMSSFALQASFPARRHHLVLEFLERGLISGLNADLSASLNY